MMVYELYFEEHLKEVGIDILSIINDQLLMVNDNNLQLTTNNYSTNNLPLTINNFYSWYQQPNNAVRQRIEMANEKSPNILAIINKAT